MSERGTRRQLTSGDPRHGHFKTHFDEPSLDYAAARRAITEQTIAELRMIAARYPQARSALLPMLHLVQSVEGRVTPAGSRSAPRSSRSARPMSVGSRRSTRCTSGGRWGVPRRRLHHRAVRDHGRRRGVREAPGSSGDRQRRDDRRRQDHPGAPGVQRGLRHGAGDDGQLGVLRQHHAGAGLPGRRPDPGRRQGQADPGCRGLHLEAGRARAGRFPRRPGRRGPDRGGRIPARPAHRRRIAAGARRRTPDATSPWTSEYGREDGGDHGRHC